MHFLTTQMLSNAQACLSIGLRKLAQVHNHAPSRWVGPRVDIKAYPYNITTQRHLVLPHVHAASVHATHFLP